jgi:3-oxoacyl-[acyl-carrier protein] reductase
MSTTPENINKHFSINSRAYALLMSEYVKRYIKREADWGRIINISTDAAHSHVANINYAASKHAIESYSRSAAAGAEIEEGTPLNRVGEPEDVSDVIVFLASEQARWVTGQLLYVGGGWRMSQ